MENLAGIIENQRHFFAGGFTRDVDYRIEKLKALRTAIQKNENAIFDALKADLKKPGTEAYGAEISPVIQEINYAIKNVRSWAKPKKVRTPLILFPAHSEIYQEPYGNTLIISPWNYPFRLAMMPLVGSIAAGNCSIVKPSELASNTADITSKIIGMSFPQSYVASVQGGVEETKELLSYKFDYIFFTGGVHVGRIIMEAAAKNLTPVTLELGGKCPCIVDETADLDISAARIAWGKFYNAGQSCIAPDYLLANHKVKEELLNLLEKKIKEFYGGNPEQSPDYARIINGNHFDRLAELLEGDVKIGGEFDKDNLYISPTIIDNAAWDDKIMKDEIFGPILPVLEYSNLNEAIQQVNAQPKPLALYFFSKDKNMQEKILEQTSSGGVSINDVISHLQNNELPFGGVGFSGMGAYQGKASFGTFSHSKPVLKRSFMADPKIRYPPYNISMNILKQILKISS